MAFAALRRLLKRGRSMGLALVLAFVVLWSFLYKQSSLIERHRQHLVASPPRSSNASCSNSSSSSIPITRPTSLVFDSNVTQVGRGRRRKVTVELVGCARLGNHLFGHASMLGLAHRHRLQPTVSSASKVFLSAFDSGIPSVDDAFVGWKTCEEKLPSGYDDNVDRQIRMSSADIRLVGYFQSWRYFDHIRQRIIRHFRFKPATAKRAAKLIESIANRHSPSHRISSSSNSSSSGNLSLAVVNDSRIDVVLVGIHVRRGDMTTSLEKGYTVASPEYLQRAMALMEDSIFNSSSSNSSINGSVVVVYVVVSDDVAWCMANVKSLRFPVEYVSNSAEVDLAILASCDHTIFTVGSFGWWAAYLAGGLAVYYRDYPANGSQLWKGFRAADYFHPSWVGLS